MQKNCIIVPCYNEAERLDLIKFSDFILQNQHIDFCFVNDGSSDQTLERLHLFKEKNTERVLIIDLPLNKGKAEAVRQGMMGAFSWKTYTTIGYWDADLSTPLVEINYLIEFLQSGVSFKVVFGSRVKRLGSDIERKVMRHILGRIFCTFSSYILKMPVYDSQCGAKLFLAELVPVLFDRPFKTAWLFDVEIIARLRNHAGLTQALEMMVEAPLHTWKEVGGSKLKFVNFIRVPFDLIKIHFTYNSH